TSDRLSESRRNQRLGEDRGKPVLPGYALHVGDAGRGGLRVWVQTADSDLGEVVPLSQIAESGMSGDELGSYTMPQPGAKGSVKLAQLHLQRPRVVRII